MALPSDGADAFWDAYDAEQPPLDAPTPTVTAGGGRGGGHLGLVAALLRKHGAGEPTGTIGGQPYVISDIGLRMLQPRELARAQGFEDTYQLTGTKREQVARIGRIPAQIGDGVHHLGAIQQRGHIAAQ